MEGEADGGFRREVLEETEGDAFPGFVVERVDEVLERAQFRDFVLAHVDEGIGQREAGADFAFAFPEGFHAAAVVGLGEAAEAFGGAGAHHFVLVEEVFFEEGAIGFVGQHGHGFEEGAADFVAFGAFPGFAERGVGIFVAEEGDGLDGGELDLFVGVAEHVEEAGGDGGVADLFERGEDFVEDGGVFGSEGGEELFAGGFAAEDAQGASGGGTAVHGGRFGGYLAEGGDDFGAGFDVEGGDGFVGASEAFHDRIGTALEAAAPAGLVVAGEVEIDEAIGGHALDFAIAIGEGVGEGFERGLAADGDERFDGGAANGGVDIAEERLQLFDAGSAVLAHGFGGFDALLRVSRFWILGPDQG